MSAILCVCLWLPIAVSCASAPSIEKPQFTPWYYTFTVLLEPDMPAESPRLELALSLLHMEYPAAQADYFHQLLYSGGNFTKYKDQVISEQRSIYRSAINEESLEEETPAELNWRRSESIVLLRSLNQGLVIERDIVNFSGGDHEIQSKRYYVLDMEELRQIKIDDFFTDYQEQERLRDLVYEEMRKYSDLSRGQKLSEGIFFSDEPELSFNFFLSDEGLILHWDPQQIAPYSYGDIDITVPWYAIRPMMLTSGIQLLTKFNIHLFM